MLSLILTNDWELFGDGSGDYFSLQHKPLEDLLERLKGSNVKITLMAEVCQQLAHRAFSVQYPELESIANAWDEVALRAVREGHDAQLHLHPQWLGAERNGDKWKLNMNRWAISSLPPEEISILIRKGKQYLEELIKPHKSDYSCICFRAGAYCLQPERFVLSALKENNILCDTSVTKGFVLTGFFDFREAHSNLVPYITDDSNICKSSDKEEGLLEMPIYSTEGMESKALAKFFPKLNSLVKYGVIPDERDLKWQKERERVKNKLYPREARFYKKYDKKNLSWYLSAIANRGAQQLDYDFLAPKVFVKMLNDIINNRKYKPYFEKGIRLPVVATGHIKDMHNSDNLLRIIELISSKLSGQVEYSTLSASSLKWRTLAF